MALGSNQPVTEIGGKGGRCVKLTTLPPSCADCLEIWEPQPPRTLRSCPVLYRVALPLPLPRPSSIALCGEVLIVCVISLQGRTVSFAAVLLFFLKSVFF